MRKTLYWFVPLVLIVIAVLTYMNERMTSSITYTYGGAPQQSQQTPPPAPPTPPQLPKEPNLVPKELPGKTVTQASGLAYTDEKVGQGKAATAGDTVTVNYTGWLTDGSRFDSSIGKAPFTLTLGAGSVIKGWDQGLQGMKVGGQRDLFIPADLGYGFAGHPPVIPPNAKLVFHVEVLSIGKGSRMPNMPVPPPNIPAPGNR
jgi:hypothetical protein